MSACSLNSFFTSSLSYNNSTRLRYPGRVCSCIVFPESTSPKRFAHFCWQVLLPLSQCLHEPPKPATTRLWQMGTALGVRTISSMMQTKIASQDNTIKKQAAVQLKRKAATRRFGSRLATRTNRVAARALLLSRLNLFRLSGWLCCLLIPGMSFMRRRCSRHLRV
jgi:hypothetical protein